MSKTRLSIFAVSIFLLGSSAAHAVLIDRGSGLIYDTDLNVTWLQDAQYALTTGAAFPGMTWSDANSWAASLDYYDSIRGTTYGDWRLPGTINLPSSSGFDTTGLSSELAYMYYINLGYAANTNMVDTSAPPPTSSNYNPFTNLAYLGYWSGTDGQIPDRQRAWALHFHWGYQTLADQAEGLRVWAVRDGDVGLTSSVPEPEGSALFGLAMAGIWFARRRRTVACDHKAVADRQQ